VTPSVCNARCALRVAVLPHEFGHSLMAWMWGIKSDPWKITWGYGGIGDILPLLGVGEKVGPVAVSPNGSGPHRPTSDAAA